MDQGGCVRLTRNCGPLLPVGLRHSGRRVNEVRRKEREPFFRDPRPNGTFQIGGTSSESEKCQEELSHHTLLSERRSL